MLEKKLECYGIIPARYSSSRFPGKPLVDIQGKPMFWHVYNQAKQASIFNNIILATDSEEICKAAEALSVPYLMTRTTHETGTDRVYEAAMKLGIPDQAIVINIQGDEPLLNPEDLCQLVSPFSDPSVYVATLAMSITEEKACSPHQVKVVTASNGDALYFSRSLIPYSREPEMDIQNKYLGHIGLYAFRMKTLKIFVHLPVSQLEQVEKLEQLRLLENNIPIRVVHTKNASIGVDTPEDLVFVNKVLAQRTLDREM